jgi:hypothetical protein
MTRRRLIQLLGVAGVAVGAPLLTSALWRGRRTPPAERQPAQPGPFPYLTLGPGVLEAFEADYERYVGPLPPRDRWPDAMQAQFLLSTDFFRFDADESRLVSYAGFYDATVTPCNNPLARFD